jgi:PAS domain S-box-containing protein
MQTKLDFLAGGGEMGERIRAFDWAATSLGPPARWPPGLRMALRVLLTTGHPIFIFWGPAHICFYNDAYSHSLGPEKHPSMLGARGQESWQEIWHIIGPDIQSVLSGGPATWYENALVPIDRHGHREDVYWTYSYGPIHEESAPNGVGGVLVICTETTGQVLAKQQLAEQVERQRRLFTKAPGFICILEGPEHRFEFVNDAHVQLFGERNSIGKTIREVFPDLVGQGFYELLDHVYASGQRYIAHGIPARLSDGPGGQLKELLLDFIYEPIFDDTGTITGIFCEGHDVSERLRAEAKLRDAEHRYRLLIDSAKDYAIISLDPDGRITSWNIGAERMMGYTEQEAVGQNTSLFFTPEDIAAGAPQREMQRALVNGRAENERWHQRKDGSRFWGSGLLTPLASGEVQGFVKIFQDRTVQHEALASRDEALARLREADQQKDEFLATLAHELRNPLSPIRYAARLLRHGNMPETIDRARTVIERQSAQMARLLDDLLDVSRITRNAIELRRAPLDLRAAVELAVETARPLIDAVKHTLEVHLPPETLPVMGDSARLAQVISNLLHNAAKFTRPGGRIVVRVERTEHDALVHVIDNGIGLSADSLDRVFGLFAQVASSEGDGPRGGLGIGLAVVKRLVELHGGSVTATSAGPGRGAEFMIRLPLAPRPAQTETAAGNVVPIRGQQVQVLIVDDNVDAADSLAAILESVGYAVRTAYDGVAAMELAEILQPALVLLDLGLPRADGYAVARWIRQQCWGADVRIVAVTGWGQEKDREGTRLAGFDKHLVKPVDPDALEQLLLELNVAEVAR